METEHERVQEILAARALRSLEEDAFDLSEALIRDHLPACATCRQMLVDFEGVAGELALAAPSRRPPATLQARIHRIARRDRRWLGVGGTATAAVILVAMGLGAWSVHLTGRISRAEQQQAQTAELISAVTVPDSKVVQLAPPGSAAGATAVAAVYVPGRSGLYVVGNMPSPRSDRIYQVWLRREGRFASGGTFLPGPRGIVLVRVPADGSAFDHVLITEELGEGSDRPSANWVAESDL